jgi:hypothetical protein
MKEQIKLEPMVPARNGVVHYCAYCGEDAGTGKFCKTCKTKSGRDGILKENIAVLKQLREKGFCLGEVLLPST